MIVLNVGGGSRNLPQQYDGWEQHLLDIDPDVNPDIEVDGKELVNYGVEGFFYDAVYCSHNLEHYYKHDVPQVLSGFHKVLKVGGVVEIHVPNVRNLMESMLSANMDIDDVWYRVTDNSPVTFHDVLYGWTVAMQQGNLFYSHKCGFTPLSLGTALARAGFKNIRITDQKQNIKAEAVKE